MEAAGLTASVEGLSDVMSFGASISKKTSDSALDLYMSALDDDDIIMSPVKLMIIIWQRRNLPKKDIKKLQNLIIKLKWIEKDEFIIYF